MNADYSNFKFSADILAMSAKDFKKLVRRRYGLTIKKATELYRHAHGLDTRLSEEGSEAGE